MMNLSDEYSDEQCRKAIAWVDDQITAFRKAGLWDTAEEYDCILSMLCRLQDLVEEAGPTPGYEGNPDDEKLPRGFVPPGYVLHDEGYYAP